MNKLYEQIIFKNDSAPAINEDNLNAMSKAISDIDDRVITGYAAVVEASLDVAEIREIATEVRADKTAVENAKTEAITAATTATTKAQEASSTVSDLSAQFQDCIDKIDELLGEEVTANG